MLGPVVEPVAPAAVTSEVGLTLPTLDDDGGELRWRRAWPVRREGQPEVDLVAEALRSDGRVAAVRLRRAGSGWRASVVDDDQILPDLDAWVTRPRTRLVAHRAGKRAVLRVDAPDGSPEAWVKVARRSATERARARLAEVTTALAGRPGCPRLPEPAALQGGGGVLVLGPLAGCSVADLLTGAANGAVADTGVHAAGLATADAVVALSGAIAPGLPVHSLVDEARVLRTWVADALAAGALRGGAARALELAAAAVAGALADLPPADVVPSHRDLHDGQVLVDLDPAGRTHGSPVAMLDLDTAARADAVLDPANLLAHLDLLAVRHPAVAGSCRAFEDALLGRLADAGHLAATDPGRLALLRSATRLRLAAVHAFRPGAEVVVPALLGVTTQ